MIESLYCAHLQVQRERMDRALAECGYDSVAIYAGEPHLQFLDDQPYPFKANPHFKLWLPLTNAPGSWLIYRPTGELRLLFLQPLDFWHKPPTMPDEFWTQHVATTVLRDSSEAQLHLRELPRCAFIGEWNPRFDEYGFAGRNPEDLLARLHFWRATKTSYEIECMRRASQRGAKAHRAAELAFRDGASEYAIHLAYLEACEHVDEELPYPSIVALNENAAVLHYQHRDRRPPRARHSFLIDAGAEVGGYGCDITRTYAAHSNDFAELIERMDAIQQGLCAQVRSGTEYIDIHLNAHRAIAGLLWEADIISLNAPNAIETGLSSVFFPHGIGHLLGLQVHDVGGFSIDEKGTRRDKPARHPYLRLTRALAPGFVVTIEPGLYFIESLLEKARASNLRQHINWKAIEHFKPYGGIRIEDDVVCTEGEPENLTRDAFSRA
jgi:Xaa-Pro dipeptidase